jgi:hypothetical protein
MKTISLFRVLLFCGVFFGNSAWAIDWDLHGSIGEGSSKHKRYVPPISNPLFNETPFITTEARILHQYTDIARSWASTGGVINLYAAQIRVALTERIGFIATKDGYANMNFKSTLADEEDFANISLGFKYAVHSNPDKNSILTVGLEYEAPAGDLETSDIRLQGGGAGFLDLFVTGSKTFGNLGLQSSFGHNFALDGDHDSSLFHYSATANYEISRGVFPTLELNGYATTSNGSRTSADYEGIDVINFGSTNSGHVALASFGTRYVVTDHINIGGSYEVPVTDRVDTVNWRTHFDLVITY